MTDNEAAEKSLTLLQRLHFKTSKGDLRWVDSSDGIGFECLVGDYKIRLKSIADIDWPDKPDYVITVINDQTGREVDKISNYTLRPVMDRVQDGHNPYYLLNGLYESARRQALGVDDAIESILGALGEG